MLQRTPIDINYLKSNRVLSYNLLTLISSSTIEEALKDPITLAVLSSDNGMGADYAENFVLKMIDYICNSFHRVTPMGDDDRKDLASLFLRRNSFLSISDCRVFADMVVAGEINSGTAGREEYKLIDVNKAGILDKLRVYKGMRYSIERRQAEERQREIESYQVTAPHMLTQWHLTHDFLGNEMPEGWNAEAYWRAKPSPEELDTIIMPKIQRTIAAFYENNCNND